jgi:UTP--glucose-1-phosphate uridylyltransferase
LATTPKGAGGELQLTDAIATLLNKEKVFAFRFQGTRYDCGSKIGFLQATVDLGENHSQVGKEFSAWLSARS